MKLKNKLTSTVACTAIVLASAGAAVGNEDSTVDPPADLMELVLVQESLPTNSFPLATYQERDSTQAEEEKAGFPGGKPPTIVNLPMVSPKTGCARADAGNFTWSVAWQSLVCIPLGFWTFGIGFACGLVGNAASTYLPWDNIC